MATFGDLDTRKMVEKQLQDAHREAELFINAVPSILIGLDSQGRIKRWNEAAARTFDLKDTAVLGKPLASCGIKWLNPEIEFEISSLLQSERRVSLDGFRFEKGGESRLLGITVNWIKLRHSRRGELLIVGSDITEKKKAENELRFKTAFLEAQIQATIDGILVVDERGSIVWKNQKFLGIFDVPPALWNSRSDELILQHAVEKVEDPKHFLQKVKYLYVHRHETSRDEIRFRNGIALDRYSSPVFGKDGHYYGRIWTFRDITQRKQNEDALRQLSVAVEQSPVSVVITDLKANITYVNRRFTECTGYAYDPTSVVVDSVQSPLHILPRRRIRQMWQTIARGEEWRGELRNKKKNGDLYWESVVISPIRSGGGETSHYLAVKEDITEKKFAESHSRQAQKLEAIGQLAAGIAHEINTPIQFIGDNTRFIKEAWAALEQAIS